jgi:hypothetical protein
MTTFEAFKTSNEEKLTETSGGSARMSTIDNERISSALDDMKRRLDDLALKRAYARRSALVRSRAAVPSEHKARRSTPICGAAMRARNAFARCTQ